jgi:hypothetical protein
MRGLIKTVLRGALVPIVRVLGPAFENIRRIHSYLLLSARLVPHVDTSVVVLGPPEVRGTGEIYLGRNLLLYPDLYLETQPGASIKIADDVVISRGVHIVAYSGITIGAGSMIGEYTTRITCEMPTALCVTERTRRRISSLVPRSGSAEVSPSSPALTSVRMRLWEQMQW